MVDIEHFVIGALTVAAVGGLGYIGVTSAYDLGHKLIRERPAAQRILNQAPFFVDQTWRDEPAVFEVKREENGLNITITYGSRISGEKVFGALLDRIFDGKALPDVEEVSVPREWSYLDRTANGFSGDDTLNDREISSNRNLINWGIRSDYREILNNLDVLLRNNPDAVIRRDNFSSD